MKLNPLRGLPNPKEVFAWGLYDFANQSFTLLIITLLFPIYFREVLVGDEARGDAIWGWLGSGSLLVVVLLGPVIGATADGFGIKKKLLVITGVISGVLTCLLSVSGLMTGTGAVVFAAVVFVLANIMYQLGENMLASFLPEISTPRNIGRVSATGWTMGYIGALLLLVISAGTMLLFELPVERWGVFFVFAGVWFLLGILMPAVVLKETPARDAEARERGAVVVAFERVASTVRQAARYRQLLRFLLAFFVYGFGVQTMVYFSGIIAKDFGFEETKLILFMLQLTVTAGIAAALTGRFQDRIGGKNTVIVYLVGWILASGALTWLTFLPEGSRPEWVFWVVGNGIGLALGGIGAASRAVVGRFTPRHKTAEFFGLWGLTYKFAGVVGLLVFGTVRSGLKSAGYSDGWSMAVLTSFFVVGLVLLVTLVNEVSGLCAATRSEREFLRGSGGLPRA